MSVYSALTCVLIALLPQDVAKTAIQDELLLTAQTHFGVVDRVEPHELNQPLVTLGHKLFWDARISANKQVACASCHSAAAGGADAVPQSIDAKGQPTKRNSQTVFNAMLQPSLRWTGDRNSGAHQAEKSLTGSMGFAKAEDVNNVLQEHGYGPLFQTAFPADPNPIRPGNYATAVEAYEATLRTPAPFDKFLLGEVRSLSKRQQKGLQLFIEIGCANCHSGKLLGGDGFERFGIHREYWTETQSRQQDVGLFETTKNEEDKFRFRVAMLRNIEKTAPYFHDGSVATLSEAVRIMANLQLDRQLSPTEIEAIVDFLSSLTGEIPANYSAPAFPDMEFSEMSKPKSEWRIEQYGSMRETIGMQQHQGRVALGSLSARPHFFAVGALEKLQGEVTIVEGQVFATGVTANGLPRSLNNDIDGRQATLLVGAEVSEWTDHKFHESMSGAKLEQWIQQQATAVGLDTKQAFPFTISGQLTELRVHVINGACPVHAKRQNKPIPADHAPFEAELQDLSARVVGIFAQGATGKLTHPGSSLHAHVIYEHESAGQITGHLESLEVAAGAVLRLPVPNAAGD